jgi:hypothetical protein
MKLSNIDDQPVREFGISHAVSGLACLRKGSWKIISPTASPTTKTGIGPLAPSSAKSVT